METVSPAPLGGELDPRKLTQWSIYSVRPWTVAALLRLGAAQGIGLGCIVLAWFLTSGEGDLGVQINWLKLGIAGVIVSGLANAAWLLRGRQVVGLARVSLLRAYERQQELTVAVADRPNSAAVLLAGPAMTRYHRAGCPMIEGKPVTADSGVAHDRAGRTPCELCVP